MKKDIYIIKNDINKFMRERVNMGNRLIIEVNGPDEIYEMMKNLVMQNPHTMRIIEDNAENDHIRFKTLPETKVLSIYHKGSYENIGEAYAFLMKYAEQNGYTNAGLARESYIDGIWNKESEEDWLTEIQLPIE